MCLQWGICRHRRKGISDSSNLDYVVKNLWNDNTALSVTITPVPQSLLRRSSMVGFLLSVFLPSSDESCTSTLLVTQDCTQTLHTPFSTHSSIQHPTWNQGKGFSPIISSNNGKNDSMKVSPQKSKRNNPPDSIIFWSAIFCDSSNPPLKKETTATTRYCMILLISASRIYVLWWKENHLNHLQSLLTEKTTGRTKTPPFDTSELLQQFSEFGRRRPYIQSLAWKSYVLVYTSFWLQVEKE